jgi:glutamate-1-semialdehyde 2,1-aminomutase
MAMAIRLTRAATGRERVAFCGYHGWSDWYLAANAPRDSAGDDPLAGHLLAGLSPRGVPVGLGGTALPFGYNKIDELEQLVRDYGRDLAAIVMEPTRNRHPEPGFLEGARVLADECGAALVFDEISAGWRFALGGAHLRYGVKPDVAVFAKALGNGHPIGAVIGRTKVMQAAQESFVSSTYWTEGVGPTAALATIHKLQSLDAPAHVERIGNQMREGWTALGKKHGVPAIATGHAALLSLSFDHQQAAALGTLVTARILEHGFLLGSGFYPSLAHAPRHVQACLTALDPVFAELADAIARNDVQSRLPGGVRHTGFARLT